jgi:quinol monooxygenase YgiN
MFARVITIKARPGKMPEAVKLSEEVVVPSVQTYPGFHHWYSFVDWKQEKGVSIAVWENEADMNRYQQEVMPGVFQELSKYIEIESAQVETFDVPISAPADVMPV